MKLLLALFLLTTFVYAKSDKYVLGEKIYQSTCISCHGADGKAKTGIKFIVNPRSLKQTILSEEQIYQITKKGAHFHGASVDIMPSFESVLQENELRAVSHYIIKKFDAKSLLRINELYAKSDKIDEAKKVTMLKRGKKIYTRNCSWCHGINGKGDGEATKNPEMSIFPYDLKKTLLDEKQMFLYTKYGGKYWGTAREDMPSWKRKYDDYTLKSVVKYINIEFKKKE